MESIGSRTHICETELGSDEDEEDMYYPDPEGPNIDEPITDEEWLNLNTYYFGYLLFFVISLFEPGGRGYSWEFLVGDVPPGSPNPDPILDQQNNVIFHSCFQTRPLKSIPDFRLGL